MRRSRLALYGLAHFWVDLSCAALLLGTLSGEGDFQLQLLVYNFCAFALQMPLGVLAVMGIDGDSLFQCLYHVLAFAGNRRKIHMKRVGYPYDPKS